jgi:GntR family transcriptional regulator
MEQYGVSRSTVRQAILALVNKGYLRREKSKGTIVRSPTGRIRFVGSLISFSDEMRQKGISHHSRILDQQVLQADANIAEKLNLQVGAEVFLLKRVRYVDNAPLLIDMHYIPYAYCPGIKSKYKENTSLYELLRHEYDFNLHHGQIKFEAVSPSSEEVIELLEIFPTTSLIMAERIVYSNQEVPLDYFFAIIHGKFSIDIMVDES